MATTEPRAPTIRRPVLVLNLPNGLTALRFALAPLFFALVANAWYFSSLVVFSLAALTDWLDGFFARRRGEMTTFGRVLDPLVDKVIVCGGFIFLIPIAHAGVAAWMVTVIVGREIVVNGLRGFFEAHGHPFGAQSAGKVKMIFQCAAIVCILADLWLAPGLMNPAVVYWVELLRENLVWATVGVTIASAYPYLLQAAALFRVQE